MLWNLAKLRTHPLKPTDDTADNRVTNQLAARVRSSLRRGWMSGLPHIVVALISIQGAAYIVQFAIARLVSPASFGVVRTVEATFSLALVIASAGLPSLAIKSVAAMQTEAQRGRLLRRLLASFC